MEEFGEMELDIRELKMGALKILLKVWPFGFMCAKESKVES